MWAPEGAMANTDGAEELNSRPIKEQLLAHHLEFEGLYFYSCHLSLMKV